MTKNPVAANLLMAVLLIGGLMTLPRIKQEVFPEFEMDIITAAFTYPGASPEEVEQAVVLAVEEAINGLDGVEDVSSRAGEGSATISIDVLSDADPDEVLVDVRGAIDRITSFPADVENQGVSLLTNRHDVLSILIYGEHLDEQTLRYLANGFRDDLLLDDRITMVEVGGIRPVEVSIEVSQQNLTRYRLTLNQIAQIVRTGSVDLPSGGMRTPGGEVLIRLNERRTIGSEFESLIVASDADGSVLTLGEIAHIDDGFRETDQETYYNGQRAAIVRVYRVGQEGPISVSDAVHEYLASRTDSLPEGVHVAVPRDRSEMYRGRIDLLLRNGYLGLALVLLTLGLFLEIRLAFWVTLGIPISFAGAMLFMPSADVSLNMISLFAFILTLGIVVDDAIIVGEAIFYQRRKGLAPMAAALAGVKEVAGPVIFAVLTTMMTFLPLMFMPGMMGKFMIVIPIMVMMVFSVSLVECLLILPAHLGHEMPYILRFILFIPNAIFGPISRRTSRWLESFVEKVYTPFVRRVVRARYLTMAVGIGILIITMGVVASGQIKRIHMPEVESDRIRVTVSMPFGTPIEDTRVAGQRVMAALDSIAEQFGDINEYSRGVLGLIGSTSRSMGPRAGAGRSGSHIYQVVVYLVPLDERDFGSIEFSQAWREAIGQIPGAEQVAFRFSMGPRVGSPIAVELTHTDAITLETAAADLAGRLAVYEGVHEIDDGFASGKEQLNVQLRPEARSLGVTELELGRQLRSRFYGAEAVRQQRGRDELRVYVRLPEDERRSEYDFETLLVRTPSGGEMPLVQAADVSRGRTYTSINRKNGRRVLEVTAEINAEIANAAEIGEDLQATILPQLANDYPGLDYVMEGEQRDRAEFQEAMATNYTYALFAVFVLLAIAFRSYIQPFIIMIAIPFGFVGAILGHMIMGYNISILSQMGMFALCGIVINDSLILVDAVNRYKKRGMTTLDALVAGGARRFRPIILTSLTTFFGLAPMIAETSVQARFLIPMAISLGFGVLFATFVTLLLVPAAYGIIDDIQGFFTWVFTSDKSSPMKPVETAEPASPTLT
jgi:multidrug efflux pump subunit AcrB